MEGAGKPAAAERTADELVDERYRVLRQLGAGGMGTVYEVLDERSGSHVALKRLGVKPGGGANYSLRTMFEAEYHTLAQLSHPSIISVYEYGIDDGRPYYTMEILDGTDLRSSVPCAWRQLCSWLRDIASALALLHSRRFVHRDVTPQNIRVTSRGRAKVLDFGAMMPMGVAGHVVGTPPFVAPEALLAQSIDGRSDLFALGASAYWALTRRHAFPAKTLDQLFLLWQKQPSEPAAIDPEVPPALSELVMSLLSIEPAARPRTAAEVVDRLTAIAELPKDEQLALRGAYLSKPKLVGRGTELEHVRESVLFAAAGHGGAWVVTGPPGVGRSRLLDAWALEAKLAGALIVRGGAGEGQRDYEVVRALGRQLFAQAPDRARHGAGAFAPRLAQILPEHFHVSAEPAQASTLQEYRLGLQEALHAWLLSIAEQRFTVIVVDDAERIDEPSLAVLATLAHQAPAQRLLIVIAVTERAGIEDLPALRILEQGSRCVRLGDLTREQIEELTRSLFGEVPNVSVLAQSLHEISGGNPRTCLELAEHLVDRNVVRYEAGDWILPLEVSEADLPRTVADLFAARLDALSEDARQLARALAVGVEDALTLDDYLALMGGDWDPSRVYRATGELTAQGVWVPQGQGHRFAQDVWVTSLLPQLTPEQRRNLHLRIAEILIEKQGSKYAIADHLLAAGEEARALDVIVPGLREPIEPRRGFELKGSVGAKLFARALEANRKLGRSFAERCILVETLVALANYAHVPNAVELAQDLAEELKRASGLADWEALDPALPAPERLQRALMTAFDRHQSLPEPERPLSPTEAIGALARLVVHMVGIGAANLSPTFFEKMPSLEPLVPLQPAVGAVAELVAGVHAVLTAREERARSIQNALLERLDQPDRAGLDLAVYHPIRFGLMLSLGLNEAAMGQASSLRWAAELEKDPVHKANAWRIRAFYALALADTEQAQACLREVEILSLQRSPERAHDGVHLRVQLQVQVLTEDLLGLKRTLDALLARADQHACWQPFVHLARGEYLRLRGDLPGALRQIDEGLTLAAPGQHISWPQLAAARVCVLNALNRYEDARFAGVDYLQRALANDLRPRHRLIVPHLALAEAKLAAAAAARAEALIADYRASETAGVLLGWAHETRARVALELKDAASFWTHAELCGDAYRTGQSSGLTAKHQRLLEEARRASLDPVLTGGTNALSLRANGPGGAHSAISSGIVSELANCADVRERSVRALELLMKRAGATSAYLYVIDGPTLVLTAAHGPHAPPAELDQRVSDFLADEWSGGQSELAQRSRARPAIDRPGWTRVEGHVVCPLALRCSAPHCSIVGAVVLVLPAGGRLDPALGRACAAIADALWGVGDITVGPEHLGDPLLDGESTLVGDAGDDELTARSNPAPRA